MSYKVIKDTREKNGWFFSPNPREKCLGMEVATLKTGDYTLEGYEDVFCIERKASVSEIALNLGKKKGPFEREMERMREFDHSFMLFEFNMNDLLIFPEGSYIPQRARSKVKITGSYLLKCLMEFQFTYDTKILFCGNKANAVTVPTSIFKRVTRML